ncbi:MAG TPA: NAD-dependent epimerase/dehydratase family protein, partial [Gammaproteobacteria bacterium]|nr:NAD-dependent epimerase/dehydratase family protein [Gammaproteobacteria bacterium]
MRILVTGADGFTGRHFIQAAQAQGHEIVRLKANLTDYSLVQEEVAQNSCDAVVHLAAISFVGAADESSFYRVNVVGTCNLLKALTTLTVTPKIILLASSANIYGNCDQSPISEEQVPAPLNHYAMSKLAMEHMARTYMDMLPIFFVRPFNYTGPGQGEIFILPKIAAHFAKRAPFIELGNIQVAREFNDVRF